MGNQGIFTPFLFEMRESFIDRGFERQKLIVNFWLKKRDLADKRVIMKVLKVTGVKNERRTS